MAVEQGTYNGYLDLLDKLVTFVTGLAGPETWSVLANSTSGFTTNGEVWLEAPGLAGGESIVVGIKTTSSANRWDWQFQGATSYSGAASFHTQAGAIPTAQGPPYMLLPAPPSPIVNNDYTFIANGRRVIVIAYNSNIPQVGYLGLIDPYGPPVTGRFLYPLFIGGMQTLSNSLIGDTGVGHTWFAKSFNTSIDTDPSTGHLYGEGLGVWYRISPYLSSSAGGVIKDPTPRVWTTAPQMIPDNHFIGLNPNGDMTLHDVELAVNANQVESIVGRLDGIFWGSGTQNWNGVTVTVGADDYLGVGNAFRSGINDFLFFKLV